MWLGGNAEAGDPPVVPGSDPVEFIGGGGLPLRTTINISTLGHQSGDALLVYKVTENGLSTSGMITGDVSGAGTRLYNSGSSISLELLFLNASDTTITLSGGQAVYGVWMVFRGVAQGSPYEDLTFDGAASTSGLDVTSTVDNAMIVEMGAHTGATAPTISSPGGWTARIMGTSAGPDHAAIMACKVLETAGTEGAGITYSLSLYGRIGLVLKPI